MPWTEWEAAGRGHGPSPGWGPAPADELVPSGFGLPFAPPASSPLPGAEKVAGVRVLPHHGSISRVTRRARQIRSSSSAIETAWLMESSLSCFLTVQSGIMSFTLTIHKAVRHNKQNLNTLPFALCPHFWLADSL